MDCLIDRNWSPQIQYPDDQYPDDRNSDPDGITPLGIQIACLYTDTRVPTCRSVLNEAVTSIQTETRQALARAVLVV